MTLSAQPAKELFNSYEKYKLTQITSRRFTQTDMLRWLKPLEDKQFFKKTAVGSSAEGRTIYLLEVGEGSMRVFLWSQMHGDEATATMALMDILSFFAQEPANAVVRSILDKLSLLIIPMINPDGAQRFQRRTAQRIDMNRDALQLKTPEARILRDVQQKFKPDFGFNLHDQDPRYTVGASNEVTAIALLAPAFDMSRSDNTVRTRAKNVAALLTSVFSEFIPGHVAKYDDTFEPRAFGDNIQKWGTSTVLIESGGWPNDRDKMFLRRLNYVGILNALASIADRSYLDADVSLYENLPFNSKNLYDVIIRNGSLKANENVQMLAVDVGLNLEEILDPGSQRVKLIAKVVDVGDLSTFSAFEEIPAKGARLDGSKIILDNQIPYDDVKSLILQK